MPCSYPFGLLAAVCRLGIRLPSFMFLLPAPENTLAFLTLNPREERHSSGKGFPAGPCECTFLGRAGGLVAGVTSSYQPPLVLSLIQQTPWQQGHSASPTFQTSLLTTGAWQRLVLTSLSLQPPLVWRGSPCRKGVGGAEEEGQEPVGVSVLSQELGSSR